MKKLHGAAKAMCESGGLEIRSSRINDFIYKNRNQSQVFSYCEMLQPCAHNVFSCSNPPTESLAFRY